MRGAPEVALTRNAVYHLPLQPVGNYRRRMLDQLSEWLPREKLYAMPRSLQTQGSRALGRLAFADNQLRLLARLAREIQQADPPRRALPVGQPDRPGPARQHAAHLRHRGGRRRRQRHAGRPRVTRCAAARPAALPEAEVIALLLCGAPSDPATPKPEQANVYATLTELNHFSDPGQSRSPPSTGRRPAHRSSRASRSTASTCCRWRTARRRRWATRSAHLGSYLFHELTTPLGLRLDRGRHARRSRGHDGRSAASAPTPSGFRAACCCGWPPAQACAASCSQDWQAGRRAQRDHASVEEACAERCRTRRVSMWKPSPAASTRRTRLPQ